MTGDEVVTEVKIRRSDVYSAVRNLLLNEFKVLPGDLSKTVEIKVDNRIEQVVKTSIEGTYGFRTKVEAAINQAIKEANADVKKMVKEAIADYVKGLIGDKVIEGLVSGLLAKEKT